VLASVHDACKAAVESRPAVSLRDPIVAGDRAMLDAVGQRPEIRTAFQDPRVEWVDLTQVVSIQKIIYLDRLDGRLDIASHSEAELIELCLPEGRLPAEILMAQDLDGHGVTLACASPNLRLQGAQVSEVLMPHEEGTTGSGGKLTAVTFFVGMGSPYVTVARFQDRYFLQDGYHRAAGLIARGVTVLPAIVIEAPTYESIARPGCGFFAYDVGAGAVPPLVVDFWDETVAVESLQPALKKIVRLRADEFNA
jgi:hypothetical protein